MEKAPVARPFWCWPCLAHMFCPCYPPILWISISLVLREVTPLAAAPATERSERVGEEAEERLNGHVLLTPRGRVFSPPHEALFNQSAPMATH